MRTYTLAELRALREEWVATLSDEANDRYTSDAEAYDMAMTEFFGWLNTREQTP